MNKDYAEAGKNVEGECHFFFYCTSNSQKEYYQDLSTNAYF